MLKANMKKYLIILALVIFFLIIPTQLKAIEETPVYTIYMCHSYLVEPYTSWFTQWCPYDPTPSGTAHFKMTDCWYSDTNYYVLGYGNVGSSSWLDSHLLGADCNDGNCDWYETEHWEYADDGDLLYIAVFDGSASVGQWEDFFKHGYNNAPNNNWSIKYFWKGTGACNFDEEQATYGSGPDVNIITDFVQNTFGILSSKIPYVYLLEVYDLWTDIDLASSSPSLSIDFGQVGMGNIAFSFSDDFDIGIKNKLQPYFDMFCWLLLIVYGILRIRDVFDSD